MSVLDSDSVDLIKKHIGYAKFFLNVGKRSDAQDRLKKALVVIEELSMEMDDLTSETDQLVDLTDDIYSLWKESEETSDPPGASFLLAMGDMVFLSTPGGGMSVVEVDSSNSNTFVNHPEKKVTFNVSPSARVSPSSRPSPSARMYPSVRKQIPVPSSQPVGIIGRVTSLFGRGTPPEEESVPVPTPSSVFGGQSTADREGQRSYIMEKQNTKGISSATLRDQVGYSVARFGSNPKERPGVFIEALEGITHGGTNSKPNFPRTMKDPFNKNTLLNVERYYHKFIHPVCKAQNGTGFVDLYEKTFLRYIQGKDDNSGDPLSKEDVHKMDIMVLQTVPVISGLMDGKEVIEGGDRWISAFSFLELKQDSVHLALVCSSFEKPISRINLIGDEALPNGKLMLEKVYEIAKDLKYRRVTLDSIVTAIGVYIRRGFLTSDSVFNDLFTTFNNTVRTVEESDEFEKRQYDNLISSKIKLVESRFKKATRGKGNTGYLHVEKNNNELYRRRLATDILERAHNNKKLIPTLFSMEYGASINSISDAYDSLSDKLTRAVSNVYTKDKYGIPTIAMYINV